MICILLGFATLLFSCAGTQTPESQPTVLMVENSKKPEENHPEPPAPDAECQRRLQELQTGFLRNRNAIEDIRIQQETVSAARIDELETRLALLIEAYRDLYSTVSSIRVHPHIESADTEPRRPEGFSTSGAVTDLMGGDEYALYSAGLDAHSKGFYEKSITIMKELLDQYPETEYTADALFWIGSAQMAQKRFDTAIHTFTQVTQLPRSEKRDDASLKIAQCFIQLGDVDKAREQLSHTLNRYPATPYAETIRQTLNRLSEEQ
ncbi:MAG: tetratricopeptide repeat protein [Fibrobacterota bacterium]